MFLDEFPSIFRMDQRRSLNLESKRKDREEGAEYRRLAEQYALEQIELERYRKQNQFEVRAMYDQTIEDKLKVKQIEKNLDEVKTNHKNFLFSSTKVFSFLRSGRRRTTENLR